MTCPIAGQVMVAVLIRQRFAHCQQCYDLLQQLDLQATLDGSFVVFFETGRVLDRIFGFFFIFSDQQTTRQGHYSPLQTGLLQSFPLPAWQQPFLCSAVPALPQRGIPPSRSDWRTKMLNAVVRFMPSSVNSASACAFKSASMWILDVCGYPSSHTINPFLLAIIVYAICTKKTMLCTNI